MCGHEDVFFKPMGLLNFVVELLCLVILSEPTIQCVITTYRQRSSIIKSSYKLHVHFVFQKHFFSKFSIMILVSVSHQNLELGTQLSIVVTYSQFDSNIRVFYVFLGFLRNTLKYFIQRPIFKPLYFYNDFFKIFENTSF